MTQEQLHLALPFASIANVKKYLTPLNLAMEKYNINTPKRQACFLAQLAHESGSLRYVKELASGEAYDVGRLAENLGNTPEDDGDGELYKGRGLIQITGRSNYEALSAALNYDFIADPEALCKPGAASLSAGWFWFTKGLNALADADNFLQISKRINGVNRKTGLPNGYDDRLDHWKRTRKAFGI